MVVEAGIHHHASSSISLLLLLLLLTTTTHGFSIDSMRRTIFPKTRPLQYASKEEASNSTFTTFLLDHHQPKTRNSFQQQHDNDERMIPDWEADMTNQHDTLQNELMESTTQQPHDKTVSSATARMLLLSAAALYGTNFAAVKYLVDDIPVGVFGTLRFGLAALVTLPWLLPKESTQDEWDATLAGLEVGVWTSVGYVAQAVGLETTLASTSAFVCSLAVVVVPILDYFVNNKPLERKEQLYGIVLACIGVALLELGDTASAAFSAGDALSLVQPFAFGVGFMRMERAMRLYPSEARRTTAGQLLAVFISSAAFMLVRPDPDFNLSTDVMPLLHDPMIWAGLVWTGIVTTGLTVYMETVALQTLSAAETTLIFSTEPLWGSLAAAVLLGESFGPKGMLGGGLIVTACLVSNLGLDGIRDFVTQRSTHKQQ